MRCLLVPEPPSEQHYLLVQLLLVPGLPTAQHIDPRLSLQPHLSLLFALTLLETTQLSWFSLTLFPSSMPGSAPDVLLPSSQPPVLLQRLPHNFAPHPWRAFWHASVHTWQGSGITDLFLFPYQRCSICWCLLISIFAAYIFCPHLQLYIFAVLSWVTCRFKSVCHQYDTFELLLLSSLPWINNNMQQAGVKTQHKMDLTVLANQCQTRSSPLVAQLGKPKAEGLTLPEWWGLLAAFYHSMSNRRNYSEFQCLQMNCNFSPGN